MASDGQGEGVEHRERQLDRLNRYGSTLDDQNVAHVVRDISRYPEFIAAALASPEGAAHVRAAKAEAFREAADRMPAFHDRDVPEWAITSACKWLRARAGHIEATP